MGKNIKLKFRCPNGKTGQGRTRDLVKNLWSKNQIGNKKEQRADNARYRNGSALPKWDGGHSR